MEVALLVQCAEELHWAPVFMALCSGFNTAVMGEQAQGWHPSFAIIISWGAKAPSRLPSLSQCPQPSSSWENATDA